MHCQLLSVSDHLHMVHHLFCNLKLHSNITYESITLALQDSGFVMEEPIQRVKRAHIPQWIVPSTRQNERKWNIFLPLKKFSLVLRRSGGLIRAES
jgi:hypothetical protein